mmetsp:Transcript_62609/g.135932  ORF Transcript_62609/g.135932 Transcript_62609/m.135932 type:complete len:296 (+) Transcript_62609:16-903(+)
MALRSQSRMANEVEKFSPRQHSKRLARRTRCHRAFCGAAASLPLPHCLPNTCMKKGKLSALGPPAPASGSASTRILVSTPSSSESQMSKLREPLREERSPSSSTVSMGTVRLTHSRARLLSSSFSRSASLSMPSPPPAISACGRRRGEEDPVSPRERVSASALGNVNASSDGILRLGKFAICAVAAMPSEFPLEDRPRQVPPRGVGIVDPLDVSGASASLGARLVPRALLAGSSSRQRKKACSRRSRAEGRIVGSTIRHCDTKSTKSFEDACVSLSPLGGLLPITNIARVGGMWK